MSLFIAAFPCPFDLAGTAHAVLETKGNLHFGEESGFKGRKSKGGVRIHTLATSNGSPYQSASPAWPQSICLHIIIIYGPTMRHV